MGFVLSNWPLPRGAAEVVQTNLTSHRSFGLDQDCITDFGDS